MLDPNQYAASKAASTVSITNNNDGTYTLVFQKFDPNTGAKTGSTSQTTTVADVQGSIDYITNVLAEWNQLSTDLQATQPVQ